MSAHEQFSLKFIIPRILQDRWDYEPNPDISKSEFEHFFIFWNEYHGTEFFWKIPQNSL